MNDKLNVVSIEAFDINDAWFQCIKKCVEVGYEYVITRGSYEGQKRLEFDFITVNIRKPSNRPLHILMPEGTSLPSPSDADQIDKYFAHYIMSDEKSVSEDYTYGARLNQSKLKGLAEAVRMQLCRRGINQIALQQSDEKSILDKIKELALNPEEEISPIEAVINMYAAQGFGTNQATMEIAMPADIFFHDPPCLRMIDTRIRYGKLHFIVYFRSWDLYAGFPVNLAGIQLLKEYMVSEINERLSKKGKEERVEDGEIIACSKGLHIYEQYKELANARLGKK